MTNKKRHAFAAILIFVGLLSNIFVLEQFSPDRQITDLALIVNIVVFQLTLILLGISIISKKQLMFISTALMLSAFLLVTGYNGKLIISNISKLTGRGSVSPPLAGGKNFEQRLLDQVIFFDIKGIAELGLETGKILYDLHQSSHTLKVRIPEQAVLDTAFGVDPLIEDLYLGQVRFAITLAVGDSAPRTLFRKDIDLKRQRSGGDGVWNPVHLDLSEFSGSDVTLCFIKDFPRDSENQPKIVYDLLPLDFMLWKKPQIRPKNLAGRLNVILISLDALRVDHLHFMGYRRETSPNLDRLSRKGTYFSTVVSQAPWTTPSHHSLFTSTYPSVHGANLPIQFAQSRLNEKLPTMANILQEQGYLTGAFTGRGSISAELGFYRGFDFYNETEVPLSQRSDAEPVFRKAANWIEENRDRTFYLFLHTYEIHAAYIDDYFVRLEDIDESNNIASDTARYDGDIRWTDAQLGNFLIRLNELGLSNRTLIVVTSDHGEDLGGRPECVFWHGHGHSLYDDLLLVPLLFVHPGTIPAGEEIRYQVRLIDVLPTVLEYLGFGLEPTFQGKSLKAMIEGRDRADLPAYSEATTYGPERKSLRYGGFKLIHRLSYGQLSDPTSQGYPLTPLFEVYDLRADPGEKNNIADQRPDIVEGYWKMMRTINPRLEAESVWTRTGNRIDISKDKSRMDALRSLGYIK
jgi:arylsulfatase A-like enzyme